MTASIEDVLPELFARVRRIFPGPSLCLQVSVLLHGAIATLFPRCTFRVRLGGLLVLSQGGTNNIQFDPRGPDGIDGGFHAWIEDDAGTLIDASVCATLRGNGYAVDADDLLLLDGRKAAFSDLLFEYEEIADLELRGLEESGALLDDMLAYVLTGTRFRPGYVALDVGWRSTGLPPRG